MNARGPLETMGPSGPYPLVRIHGDPFDRGRQYGRIARTRIHHTLNAYSDLFREYTGLEWKDIIARAQEFLPVITAVAPHLVAEMRGIADGANVGFSDILAVNVRTEVMYGVGELRGLECTAFAATREATADGHILVGQNWDWHPAAFESCIILAIESEDPPSIVTVVEAGLLAKMGLNSAGVGVATNAMVTDLDLGLPGVPYHVLLRRALEQPSAAAAADLITNSDRSSSANFLLADPSGYVVDLETAPGGPENVFVIQPCDGVIAHANCFVSPDATVNDQTAVRKPISIMRQRTMQAALDANGGTISIPVMQKVLANHHHQPNALCRHPLGELAPIDRSATVASVLMDLDSIDFWVADGEPCRQEYRLFRPSDLWVGHGTARDSPQVAT
jgi:isopenicillin-N N-acyltransferase-like protein